MGPVSAASIAILGHPKREQRCALMNNPDRADRKYPRPLRLIEAVATGDARTQSWTRSTGGDSGYHRALRGHGSPVITDGEQRKYHNFWTYLRSWLPNTAPDGFRIPFSAGHTRRMPAADLWPFRYKRHAEPVTWTWLCAMPRAREARRSSRPRPEPHVPGPTRSRLLPRAVPPDLLREHETEVRACLRKGAHKVQIDFTKDGWR